MTIGVHGKSEILDAPLTFASSGLVSESDPPFYLFTAEGLQDKYLLGTILKRVLNCGKLFLAIL